MWWQKINPSLTGSSAGQSEETPEVQTWALYDFNNNKLGTFLVTDPNTGPSIGELGQISAFYDVWAHTQLYYRVNEKRYVHANGAVAFYFEHVEFKWTEPEVQTDVCKKCGVKASFVRTALICPFCRGVVGGF